MRIKKLDFLNERPLCRHRHADKTALSVTVESQNPKNPRASQPKLATISAVNSGQPFQTCVGMAPSTTPPTHSVSTSADVPDILSEPECIPRILPSREETAGEEAWRATRSSALSAQWLYLCGAEWEGASGPLCRLQPEFPLVLQAVRVDVGRRAGERAQVTTVKLSHMGRGGLALTGPSGLLMPTFSGCFRCWSSSADCTSSCRTSLFHSTSTHMCPRAVAHVHRHMMLSKWNHSTSCKTGFKSVIGQEVHVTAHMWPFSASYRVTSSSTASRDRKRQCLCLSCPHFRPNKQIFLNCSGQTMGPSAFNDPQQQWWSQWHGEEKGFPELWGSTFPQLGRQLVSVTVAAVHAKGTSTAPHLNDQNSLGPHREGLWSSQPYCSHPYSPSNHNGIQPFH